LFIALNIAALGVTGSTEAAQSKSGVVRGQKRSSAKNNSQWSADPELGWVRADERQKSQDSDRAIRDAQSNRKTKGKSKGNKS
jgi:hypothetical protein